MRHSTTMLHRRTTALLLLLLAMAVPSIALACCPSDSNGNPRPNGLGQQQPAAADLAATSAWDIYAFERDGVKYLQVNDPTDTVRAGVGRIGTSMWVLPIGLDADRVAVPGDPLPATGTAVLLYRSSEFEVWRYPGENGDAWWIAPASD